MSRLSALPCTTPRPAFRNSPPYSLQSAAESRLEQDGESCEPARRASSSRREVSRRSRRDPVRRPSSRRRRRGTIREPASSGDVFCANSVDYFPLARYRPFLVTVREKGRANRRTNCLQQNKKTESDTTGRRDLLVPAFSRWRYYAQFSYLLFLQLTAMAEKCIMCGVGRDCGSVRVVGPRNVPNGVAKKRKRGAL